MLDVLARLSTLYGPDTKLNCVSDIWGSEPGTITPSEAIQLHEDLDWDDAGYTVKIGQSSGDVVLVDKDGIAILKLC